MPAPADVDQHLHRGARAVRLRARHMVGRRGRGHRPQRLGVPRWRDERDPRPVPRLRSPCAEDFDARWEEALEVRRDGAAELGAAFAAVVVPEKLGVMPPNSPSRCRTWPRPRRGARRACRSWSLLYPVAELAAVPGGAYPADRHAPDLCGQRGAGPCRRCGAGRHGSSTSWRRRGSPAASTSGDLGSRYSPPIVEVVAAPERLRRRRGGRRATARRSPRPARTWERGRCCATSAPPTAARRSSSATPMPRYGAALPGPRWFLAQAFREVHFLWVPFGWDPAYAAAARRRGRGLPGRRAVRDPPARAAGRLSRARGPGAGPPRRRVNSGHARSSAAATHAPEGAARASSRAAGAGRRRRATAPRGRARAGCRRADPRA